MRYHHCLAALSAAACAASPIAVTNAAEAGNYVCSVREAVSVKGGAGETTALSDAPKSFSLEIGEGPIFGDQLRDDPLRQTDVYEPEGRPTFVARIDAELFAKRADRLISYDRQIFSNGENTLIVLDDGDYIAYGRAPHKTYFGAAIYSGTCAASD